MVWYNVDMPPQDVKLFQLVRVGEVRKFETRPEYSSDVLSSSSRNLHYRFTFELEKVEVIKRSDNLKIKNESLLNIVQGINPPIIDNFDKVGVLSTVSPSGNSFDDKVVRKLRFNKNCLGHGYNIDSSCEVLGTYHL